MAHVRLLLSTGRVSTQNIASILARALPDAIVEHEGMGPDYFSRRVFRAPRQLRLVLGQNVALQRKLITIEDQVAAGTDYIDVGWPNYAWLPYLSERFGPHLTFMHLVRNPFHVAASLTTHGLFVSSEKKPSPFEKRAMVHAEDRSVFYKDVAKYSAEFSAFERNLFHWLELNQFALEQHSLNGFLGLARYEDLYAEADPLIAPFLTRFSGHDIVVPASPPVDKVQRTLSTKLTAVHPVLLAAVQELAERLGYGAQELQDAFDLDLLAEKYSKKRLG